MEASTIATHPRTTRGKGSNRQLRARGEIPGIVYGHGIESAISLSVDPKVLLKALLGPKGRNTLFDLAIGEGETHRVLVREIQRHPVSRALLHVDFVAPDLTRPVIAEVPLRPTGKSVGIALGGRLSMPYREVKLASLPEVIPAEVTIDVTALNEGDSIMASTIELPEGVTAIYDRDYVVAKVVAPRGRLEDEEGGEGEEAEAEEGEGASDEPAS